MLTILLVLFIISLWISCGLWAVIIELEMYRYDFYVKWGRDNFLALEKDYRENGCREIGQEIINSWRHRLLYGPLELFGVLYFDCFIPKRWPVLYFGLPKK